MSVRLSTYPEYKDSGLPLLGRIPAHWEERRAKYFFREVDERSQAGDEELLSVSHLTGVTPRSQKNVTMFQAESYVGHKLCRRGDLAVNTMWAWMAALGVARQTGIVSPSYGVYRLREDGTFLSDYLDHLLRTESYVSEYYCRSTGIRASRLRLYPDDFLDIPVVCPPSNEQRNIAEFLRFADQLVRRLIRTKQRLIELLNEQKQAIIHTAVTCGLNPDAPMKPIGLDWLPEVPKGWEVTRLGSLAASLQTGPFGSQLHTHDYEYGGTPVINPSHLKDGKIVPDVEVAVGSHKLSELSRHELKPNDIVFARRGEIGRCALVRQHEEGWLCGTGSLRMRLKSNPAYPEYLLELLLSRGVSNWLSLHSVGSTMQNLNTGILARLPLPLPPLREQKDILSFVNQQKSTITQTIRRAQREIELIREYRTRLISDVVMGKLDVRGVELPEVEEIEGTSDISGTLPPILDDFVEESHTAP